MDRVLFFVRGEEVFLHSVRVFGLSNRADIVSSSIGVIIEYDRKM